MRQYASICVNMRQYVNILSNILRIGTHCINVKMSICVNIGRPILICVNICQYAPICVNMRQYASICVNTHVTYVNMRQYAVCQYASICVNMRQYASICVNMRQYASICMVNMEGCVNVIFAVLPYWPTQKFKKFEFKLKKIQIWIYRAVAWGDIVLVQHHNRCKSQPFYAREQAHAILTHIDVVRSAGVQALVFAI